MSVSGIDVEGPTSDVATSVSGAGLVGPILWKSGELQAVTDSKNRQLIRYLGNVADLIVTDASRVE